jgi:hypothetical protein
MGEVVRLTIAGPDPDQVRRRKATMLRATERREMLRDEFAARALECASAVAAEARAGRKATPRERDQARLARARLMKVREADERAVMEVKAAWGWLLELFGGDRRRWEQWDALMPSEQDASWRDG